MKILIRKAEENDLAAINIIAQQVHQLHVNLRPDLYLAVDEVISQELFSAWLTTALVFVGLYQEQIISYAVCFPRVTDHPVMMPRKTLLLDAFGNAVEFQHCGVGRQMMEYIFDYAKISDYDAVELMVNSKNDNACQFYQHLGLKEKAHFFEKLLK